MLVENYQKIRPSIIAFVPKYEKVFDPQQSVPPFPPIIGTGFLVDSNGLIATNDHVVNAFRNVPIPPDVSDEWPVRAHLFSLSSLGVAHVPLEVLQVARISQHETGPVYYGPPKPDLAFVFVKMRGLPAVELDVEGHYQEGDDIATAGFPMGTDALMAPGWLHQIGPTLQQGIISSVLPFPCPTPHGFTINIMVQGGASGSPVFCPRNGLVKGVLYGGLNDIGLTSGDRPVRYQKPTNISYVVPSSFIKHAIDQIKEDGAISITADAPDLNEKLQQAELISSFDGSTIKKSGELKAPGPLEAKVRSIE